MVVASMALRPIPIAVVAEDGGADGPCKETDGIGRKCGDGAKRSHTGREEELVENQRRCRGVDEEVVPFDRRANDTGEDDASQRDAWRTADRLRAQLRNRFHTVSVGTRLRCLAR